jgi:hypothetical protein
MLYNKIDYSIKDGMRMANFYFTAFEKTGEILFNEVWEFENEQQAKIEGQKRIEEKGVQDKTHRLVNSQGKVILFHV